MDSTYILGCAVAGLGLGVGIVLTAGALAAPCGAAMWAVTVVKGTTALTAAGCSALTVAGAGGAAALFYPRSVSLGLSLYIGLSGPLWASLCVSVPL